SNCLLTLMKTGGEKSVRLKRPVKTGPGDQVVRCDEKSLEGEPSWMIINLMKKPAARTSRIRTEETTRESGRAQKGKIHPVVIYPFKQPGHYSDLEELYRLVARLD